MRTDQYIFRYIQDKELGLSWQEILKTDTPDILGDDLTFALVRSQLGVVNFRLSFADLSENGQLTPEN